MKMADVSPDEVAVQNEPLNGADSAPSSPPPPEPAIEEAPPEVKEEVEDTAPKAVRFNRNTWRARAVELQASLLPLFSS